MRIITERPTDYNIPCPETQLMLERADIDWRDSEVKFDYSDTDIWYPLTPRQSELFDKLGESKCFSEAFFYLMRGFYVFPLNTPYTLNDATNDFDRLAEMYSEFPDAKPALAMGVRYGYVAVRFREHGVVTYEELEMVTSYLPSTTKNIVDTWQFTNHKPNWREREDYSDKMTKLLHRAIRKGNSFRIEQILERIGKKRLEIGEDENWLIYRLDDDVQHLIPSCDGLIADGGYLITDGTWSFGESLLKNENVPPMKLPQFIYDHITSLISRSSPENNSNGDKGSRPDRRTDLDAKPLDTTVIEELNDDGNANRFVRQHGRDLLYVVERKRWFVYDDRRWTPDNAMEVQYRAKRTARSIAQEAANAESDDQFKLLLKHAQKTKHAKAIKDMLTMAESDLAVSESEFDQDLLLLNCQNGTIDLRTGELREHRREDRITKIANASYDPNAGCPIWLAFLRKITNGNQDLISFLQRAIGYSITGLVNERVVFVQHGSGANGKSVFTETILYLLGDYATVAPSSAVMKKQNNQATNDLAKLSGARFVSVNETDEGSYLNESTIKAISGNDTITARFLYGEYFDFKPRFKLWMRTNHKPNVRGIDEGIWDRLKLIPFIVRIPKHEQDKALTEKLKGERDGILTWAVRGCLEWQRIGLGVPVEVEQATDAYRKEQDVFAQFVDLCCVLAPDAWTSSRELNQLYESFCRERSQQSNLRGNMMPERLRELGCSPVNTRKGRGWQGIGILSPQWSDSDVDGDDSVDTDFMN